MSDQTFRTDRPSGEQRYGANRRLGERQFGSGRGGQISLMSSVIDAARANPIGAALVGMGIAWLLAGDQSQRLAAQASAAAAQALNSGGSVMAGMARSTGGAVGSASGYVTDAGASAARQAANMVVSAASRASEAVGSGADQAGDLASSIGETLRTTSAPAVADFVSSARSQLGQTFDEQPLLLAVGAFAIGAAMAASLPLTDTEERVLGDAAKSAMQSGEQGDSIGARLQNAATAAKKEARRQGLTPDALKTDAAKLGDRVSSSIGGVTGANSPPA